MVLRFGHVLNLNACSSIGASALPYAGGCRRFTLRMFRGALHEDPGNIVDRGTVDERFDQFCSRAQQSQQEDNDTLLPIRCRETEESAPDTVAGGSVH